MKRKIKQIFSAILALLGIVFILAPYQLFPVCNVPAPDGTPMKCAYTAKLFIAMGAIMLIVNAIALLKRKKSYYNIAYGITVIAAFINYALPKQLIRVGNKKTLGWEIGLCAKADHGCNVHTLPALEILTPLIITTAVIALILNFLVKENHD